MKWFCTPLLFLPLVLTAPCNALMSSANYTISSTVISGGGGSMSSANFGLTYTVGQTSPLGTALSASFNIDSGFWYTLILTLIGDINGDGDIDLKDVINTLHVLSGQLPTDIHKEADIDGDGKIGLGEAIMILHKLGDL